jgi:hypothetical protein
LPTDRLHNAKSWEDYAMADAKPTTLSDLIEGHRQAAAEFEAAHDAAAEKDREAVNRERNRLDDLEEKLALELLTWPCRTIKDARLKAKYVKEASVIREAIHDERYLDAWLASFE